MVYGTDRLSSFYHNTFEKQSEMTRLVLEATWRHKIYTEDASMDKLYGKLQDFSVSYKMLDDAAKVISTLKPSIEEAYNFFNDHTSDDFKMRFTKILGSELVMYVTDEIESISFEMIADRFNHKLERDLSGVFDGHTDIKDLRKRRCSSDAENKTCQDFFYSRIPEGMITKRLRTYRNVTTSIIDNNTVQRTIVPFLVEVLDVKLNDRETDSNRIKTISFKSLIKRTEASFKSLFDGMSVVRDSALTALSLDKNVKCTAYDIESLFANLYVMVYNVETRVVTYLLRMMQAYTRNIRTILDLKEVMSINDGLSSKAYTEEFAEEDVANGKGIAITNSTNLEEAADELVTSIINLTNISKEEIGDAVERHLAVNYKLMDVIGRATTMDTVMYDVINDTMNRISNNINGLIENMGGLRDENLDDDWIPFDDLLEKCDLPANPLHLFDDAMEGYDVKPAYPNPTPQQVLAELLHFRKNLVGLRHNFTRLATRIKETYEAIDKNPNDGVAQIGVDPVRARDWFAVAFDALGHCDMLLGKNFRTRLVGLSKLIFNYGVELQNAQTAWVKDMEDIPIEDEVIEYYEEEANEVLAQMHSTYVGLYRRKSRGEAMFLEEDGNQQGNQSSAPKPVVNDSGANNSGSSNNGNAQNNQNNNQQNGNNQNNNSSQQQNNNNNGSNTSSTKISVRLKAQLQKIINLIKQIFGRGDKAKNLKFLTKNKGFLLSRNYTNTSVEMLPYRKDFDYVKLLNECIDRAASISDATLKTANEDGIRNTLFGPMNIPNTGDGLDTDLIICFKVGKGKMENVTVADNNLKELVPKMIKYCENYYNNFESNLESVNGSLNKLAVFDTKKNSTDNDKTEDNIKIINDQLKVAMSSVRVVARDRCNNYLSILASLASSNKNNSDNQPTEDSGNNNK